MKIEYICINESCKKECILGCKNGKRPKRCFMYRKSYARERFGYDNDDWLIYASTEFIDTNHVIFGNVMYEAIPMNKGYRCDRCALAGTIVCSPKAAIQCDAYYRKDHVNVFWKRFYKIKVNEKIATTERLVFCIDGNNVGHYEPTIGVR